MEDATGDDCVPPRAEQRLTRLLEGRVDELRPVGRLRVDTDNVVAARREQLDEAAVTSAADFEDSARGRRQLL
jgi:hypothetical protein